MVVQIYPFVLVFASANFPHKKELIMRVKKEKCQTRDYALQHSASTQLKKPNKCICTCCHCRQQAITAEKITHTKDCCFTR